MNKFKKIGLVLLFLFSALIFQAQDKGTILVLVNAKSTILIDGDEVGVVEKSIPKKFDVDAGEHYVQAIEVSKSLNKGEIVKIEENKQKILKIEFEDFSKPEQVLVAEQKFSITGSIEVSSWMNNNPGKDYPSYPVFYYAFEQGDEVVIDLTMYNKKGTNEIKVVSIPDKSLVYKNDNFSNLNDIHIKIEKRTILKFSFSTNHAFDRDCYLKVSRIPSSEGTKDFITTVKYVKTYKAITIVKPQTSFINSGSNATFKGGKSRIAVPVELPDNTVKWYYSVAASRSESDINNVQGTMDLAGDLTKLIDKTGVLSFGINQLTKPPGADYIDVYLIDRNNYSPFLSKSEYRYMIEGTRENIMSGVVEVTKHLKGTYYLGLKNPDGFYGVNSIIEVVAIVEESEYQMDN